MWGWLALLALPLAVWAASRAAGVPVALAMFGAGTACGLVAAPLLARAGRRLVRWAHAATPSAAAPAARAGREGARR